MLCLSITFAEFLIDHVRVGDDMSRISGGCFHRQYLQLCLFCVTDNSLLTFDSTSNRIPNHIPFAWSHSGELVSTLIICDALTV